MSSDTGSVGARRVGRGGIRVEGAESATTGDVGSDGEASYPMGDTGEMLSLVERRGGIGMPIMGDGAMDACSLKGKGSSLRHDDSSGCCNKCSSRACCSAKSGSAFSVAPSLVDMVVMA